MSFYDIEMLVNLYVIILLRLMRFINEDPINKIKIISHLNYTMNLLLSKIIYSTCIKYLNKYAN